MSTTTSIFTSSNPSFPYPAVQQDDWIIQAKNGQSVYVGNDTNYLTVSSTSIQTPSTIMAPSIIANDRVTSSNIYMGPSQLVDANKNVTCAQLLADGGVSSKGRLLIFN
jgi:hypothetical protein